jgi:DNA polymerase
MLYRKEKSTKSSGIPKWFETKTRQCRKCKLCDSRRNVVIGRGISPADILFIGEAPGKTEDLLGYAFVGPSGKLLDEMINSALIILGKGKIDLSYYITNTVLCRPTDSLQSENRKPNILEVVSCTPNVMKIFSFVNPKMIILVGKVAQNLYGKEFKSIGVNILHPSFILRQGGKRSPYYLQTVRILAESLNDIIEQKKEEK